MQGALNAVLGEGPDIEIAGFSVDSRRIRPDEVFVALPGHLHHGSRFAEQAVRNGAVAIVTDIDGRSQCDSLGVPVVVVDEPRAHLGEWCRKFFQTDTLPMRLVGVTGTNGKTTVAHLVEAGCLAAGHSAGLIGTLGVRYPGFSERGERTTPEAPDVHRTLREMYEAGVGVAIMEVTSHAVVEHRIDGLVFDVAGFTNLSRDHLDFHGTMERYFAAKAALFDADRARTAVIGIDDEWGRRLAESVTIDHRTWSCRDPSADWFGTGTDQGVVVRGPQDQREEFTLHLPGGMNVANATCAVAMLGALRIPRDPSAFTDVRIPGRMETFYSDDGVRIVVDFAHTPSAIREVIATLQGTGRTWVVFGAGGDRDREKRPEMGAVASLADVIIVTDDNPRSEDPADIRAQILDGVADEHRDVRQIPDRRAAVQTAVSSAEPGDTVLVLGKGHEQGQEAHGVVTPFDDRQVVAAAITVRDAR